jgi:hypothetical protein
VEVERQHLTEPINEPTSQHRGLFSDIAYYYIKTELPKRACSTAYLQRHIAQRLTRSTQQHSARSTAKAKSRVLYGTPWGSARNVTRQ